MDLNDFLDAVFIETSFCDICHGNITDITGEIIINDTDFLLVCTKCKDK